ncbi:MAG TPA: SMP-30/gluconolactonase/LRE family protein [Mesorhizobium sp.]
MSGYRIVEHEVACVVDSHDKLGEGAFWCPDEGALYWVDIAMPSALHRLTPATGRHDSWPMPEMISALAKRGDGTLLVASQSGLGFFDPARPQLQRVAAPEAHKPANRSNDGAPDASGRFWIGTMQNNFAPDGSEIPVESATGSLWRIEAHLKATEVISGIGITNGVAWSPDSRTLYVVDSMTQTIFAYDFDLEPGTVGNRRVFSDVKDMGDPDGNAVDAQGYLWSARWEGHGLMRFAPDGTVDRVVPIPASRVTSCAFGGPDLATLYVTTSRRGVDAETLARYPQQGGLFSLRPGVSGLPRAKFAG